MVRYLPDVSQNPVYRRFSGQSAATLNFIEEFRTTAQKKQQLLSSSQAYRLAAHSSRASSAPPPRCQRPPASLQLSRSASPIAFAFFAHAGFPDAPRRRFPAVRDAVRGPLELHFDSLRSGSSRPQHTEPLPERSSSQAKTFCRIVLSMNRFPVSSSVLCSPSLGLADGAPPAPSSARRGRCSSSAPLPRRSSRPGFPPGAGAPTGPTPRAGSVCADATPPA